MNATKTNEVQAAIEKLYLGCGSNGKPCRIGRSLTAGDIQDVAAGGMVYLPVMDSAGIQVATVYVDGTTHRVALMVSGEKVRGTTW